jgi:hypothetical protein
VGICAVFRETMRRRKYREKINFGTEISGEDERGAIMN